MCEQPSDHSLRAQWLRNALYDAVLAIVHHGRATLDEDDVVVDCKNDCLCPLVTASSPPLTIIQHMTADYDFALCVRSARCLLLSNTQVFKEL